jgi:regulator of replication initiation timing
MRSGKIDVSPDRGEEAAPSQAETGAVNAARLIRENAELRNEVAALRAQLAEKEREAEMEQPADESGRKREKRRGKDKPEERQEEQAKE